MGCPEEASARILDQRTPGARAIGTPGLRAEVVEGRECASWSDFVERAAAESANRVGPAERCCPVEVLISCLDQSSVGRIAVRAAGLRAEAVECRQRTAWRDLEDRSISAGTA